MIAFTLHVVTMIAIYSLVVLGLQLAVGRGKVMFVAPTFSFAVGAYSSALLTTAAKLSPSEAMIVGAVLAGLGSAVLATLTWRLRGDHLVLATLGLCEILRSCLNNWDTMTGGSIGVMNIPPLWPKTPPAKFPLLYLTVTGVLLSIGIMYCLRLNKSPFGRIHAALSGDEAGTAALGRPVRRTKVLAISWGGVLGSIGGSMYAHYMGYVDPTTFTVGEAILLFAMLLIGGLGSPLGSVAGTAVFILLPEGMRFVGVSSAIADPLRRVVCAVVLLMIVRFRPNGLFGTYLQSATNILRTTKHG